MTSFFPDTEFEELEEYEDSPHSYEFVEPITPEEPDVYLEKWKCRHCNHERVQHIHIGVKD